MSNPGMMLTRGGKNILAKGLLGKEIHFTKVSFGAGDFDYESESVLDLNEMRDWRIDLPLVDKQIRGDGTVTIIAQLNNFDLTEGFPAKEIGVYARDPDSEEQVLYAYRNAGEEYNFIPANTGPVIKNAMRFGYVVEIQNAENVTFDINFEFAYVSREEFEKHVGEYHPEILDETDTTTKFYVHDEDDHLHKISVPNVKNLLLPEITETVSREKIQRENLQEFVQIKTELGLLEPNILQIENFTPPTLLDDTKVKITSCAKNSKTLYAKNLYGVRLGGEYYLSDGVNCELVKISDIQLLPPSVEINSSHQVLTLENNLQNSYNDEETFLYRSTVSRETKFASGNLPKLFRKWKSRTPFKGYAANVSRLVEFTF